MLRRDKKFENQDSPVVNETVPEERPGLVSSPVPKEGKTIIGEHIFIEGNIRGEEHLLIEGSMKGNIMMPRNNFLMGSKGRFEGEINAQNVTISGQMVGKITSQGRVEITKDADFLGEIKAKSIALEDGAYFKGTIELDREPHRKPANAGRPLETPVQLVDKKPTAQPDKPLKDI